MGLGGGIYARYKRERTVSRAYREDAKRRYNERMQGMREVDRLARRDEKRRRQ